VISVDVYDGEVEYELIIEQYSWSEPRKATLEEPPEEDDFEILEAYLQLPGDSRSIRGINAQLLESNKLCDRVLFYHGAAIEAALSRHEEDVCDGY